MYDKYVGVQHPLIIIKYSYILLITTSHQKCVNTAEDISLMKTLMLQNKNAYIIQITIIHHEQTVVIFFGCIDFI